MGSTPAYDETVVLPRAVRFPVELLTPPGFDAAALETWPRVVGRLEYVEGRLLFMPPCGDDQQDVVADVVITLGAWARAHRGEVVLGTNEAGMRLGGDTRAADAAIWKRTDLGRRTGGLRRVPPVLVVEVAGQDDEPEALSAKAEWYLRAGVPVVWLVWPAAREVTVITTTGSSSHGADQLLPEPAGLSGLRVAVESFFVQLDEP